MPRTPSKNRPDDPVRPGSRQRRPETEADFRKLAADFHAAAPELDHLDHETHLALIAWIVLESDEAQASQKIISGLRALERRRAVPLAPGLAYNETITMFWIAVAQSKLPRTAAPNERAAAVRAFIRAFRDRPGYVYQFFSERLVHSWEARTKWVEPDLRSLCDLSDTCCSRDR